MAASGEELEYESDPEEAKRLLTTRRREASDDEEDEERERPSGRIDSRAGIGSDEESNDQGAPADYDDDESEVEEEEFKDYEEVEEEYEVREGKEVVAVVKELLNGDGERYAGESTDFDGGNQVEEEKKENEPFAVPTAGAFYMHDDRFRDNAGGRHRQTLGGRKLWDSKSERKWGHDKFEEMTHQERDYGQGSRNSRGQYRTHGKSQGADRGYPRENRYKVYSNNTQNHGPKVVRGRGPIRYEPSGKNKSEAPPTLHKQYGKSIEKTTHATSGRKPTTAFNFESDPVSARKQASESSLNYASPPFYPSGSSNKEIALPQIRDVQVGTANRNLRSAVLDENFPMLHSNATMLGKNVVNAVGMEKLHIRDSISPIAGNPSSRSQLPPSGPSLVNTNQPLQPRAQGKGLVPSGQMDFQPGAPHNQLSTASMQRNPIQSRAQSSLQAAVQQLGQRLSSGSQTPSPSKVALSISSFDLGDLGSPSESSTSKTSMVGKGKGSAQVSGKGSFLYGGAQIMGASGNIGNTHGGQNFAGTPAFLPVMPFGGQHPGGMGVPAVGMAFPGYVAQPQLGLGNSEMAWLPVLAGAAGALGATYCSPYVPVDGSYHSHPSGQTSSSGASSKEDYTNKQSNEWKPPSQRPDASSDEFGQRQKNTRRYTEMNFGQ